MNWLCLTLAADCPFVSCSHDETCPQQVESRATMHLVFDQVQLQLGDLALDLSVGPCSRQRRPDRGEVIAGALAETRSRVPPTSTSQGLHVAITAEPHATHQLAATSRLAGDGLDRGRKSFGRSERPRILRARQVYRPCSRFAWRLERKPRRNPRRYRYPADGISLRPRTRVLGTGGREGMSLRP